MLARLYLMFAALHAWRTANPRKYPQLTEHIVRWSSFAGLLVLLYALTLLPLEVFVPVVRHARVDGTLADTIHLDGGLRWTILAGIAAMIAASLVLAGVARTVMSLFVERHVAALVIGTAAVGLSLYVGYVSAVTSSLLGFTRGDNALLAIFMITWAGAIVRVCAVAADCARDAWHARTSAFATR